ncbi:glutamate decarboxylase isozyme [Shigella dysenteriae 1617]|uniref:Uncharacterized protein n=3 Tax=Shigella dysenteriae TaxID=622 RepID=Q32CV9_SHIDS|nr:hypothetical protein SDY_2803 [Shigella dysenteriae Sd197]EFP72992.1 glutamate decarboxylase isozyme [Shigella dysenteriae 1617]
MAVTAAKSVMAFRVLTMAVDLCRLTTRTMNVNAGHERTSKARIIHQIQLIRGITTNFNVLTNWRSRYSCHQYRFLRKGSSFYDKDCKLLVKDNYPDP